MNGNHCTSDELNALLDGRLAPADIRRVMLHIDGCAACGGQLRILQGLDASLRSLPPVEARPEFAEEIAGRLRLTRRGSWLYKALGNAGYLFGLLIVLGTMVSVFVMTGVIEVERVQQGTGEAGRIALAAGDRVSGVVNALSGLLVEWLPFAFSKTSVGTAVMIAVALVVLAGFDRLLARKFLHRT
jgi:anti-sigma factor RsiW